MKYLLILLILPLSAFSVESKFHEHKAKVWFDKDGKMFINSMGTIFEIEKISRYKFHEIEFQTDNVYEIWIHYNN